MIYEEMGDDRIFSPRLKPAVAIRNLTREKIDERKSVGGESFLNGCESTQESHL